jgi:hypothetical protein
MAEGRTDAMSADDTSQPDSARARILGAAISGVAISLAILHAALPSVTVDTVTLGLVIVALLPWLKSVFTEIDLPGGWHLKFREIETRVEAQQAHVRELEHKVDEVQQLVFSGAAAPQAELRLQALVPLFQQYLGTLGLGRGVPLPEIRIETERASGLNAWVEHRTLYVGAEIADDADVAFTVYARYMVGESSPEIRDLIEGEDSQSVELTAIEWGLADYLTSSFWGRPFIGNADVAAAIPGSKLYLRSLADDVSFPDAISLDSRRTLSEAWGAAFWCVRGYLGQATADRVLVDAWLAAQGRGC